MLMYSLSVVAAMVVLIVLGMIANGEQERIIQAVQVGMVLRLQLQKISQLLKALTLLR